MSKAQQKLNLKEKINDDCLDLSMCGLEKVPIKEIVNFSKSILTESNLLFKILARVSKDKKA